MSRGLLLSSIVIVTLVVVASFSALASIAPYTSESQKASIYSQMSHATVYIGGNEEFSAQGWPGSGTSADPYVISDLNIRATGAAGIFIADVTVDFVIRDCYIHEGGWDSDGILLHSCKNGTIINNTCFNNLIGIHIESSDVNTIADNVCSANWWGMYLLSSSSNFIRDNNCSSNKDVGMLIASSSNGNILTGNICDSDNGHGIWLWSSSNGNFLSENECSNNVFGIYLESVKFNVVENNTCDSNDEVGISILYSSNGNTVSGNDCTNNNVGIFIHSSNGNTIADNFCTANWWGIYLLTSSSNILDGNNCSSNSGIGLLLSLSSNSNVIRENHCDLNGAYGIWLWSSSNSNVISDNDCGSNEIYGISLGSSRSNAVRNNTCYSNDEAGIALISSSISNTVSGNELSGNWWGVYLLSSSNSNTIVNNAFESNLDAGIYLDSSSYNKIWNNAFEKNNRGGVQACDAGTVNQWSSSSGQGNYWSDWTSPDNEAPWGIADLPYRIAGSAGAEDRYPQLGISVHATISINGNGQFCTMAASQGWAGNGTSENPYMIQDYDIDASKKNGIVIINSDVHFTISNVRVHSTSHSYEGINLMNVTNARIEKALCVDNLHGIYAVSCRNIDIVACNLSSNTGNGLYLISCTDVTIDGVNVFSNGNQGAHLSSCTQVTMGHIAATFNSYNGIYSKSCTRLSVSGGVFSENCWNGIYVVSCNTTVIEGGSYSHNGRNGIYMIQCSDSSITNSLSFNNSNRWHGIYLYSCTNSSISDCITSGNSWNGVYLNRCDRVKCSGGSHSSNFGNGLFAYSSSNISVSGGNYDSNANSGLNMSACPNAVLDTAECNGNKGKGICLYSCLAASVKGCTAANNRQEWMLLSSCAGAILSGNTNTSAYDSEGYGNTWAFMRTSDSLRIQDSKGVDIFSINDAGTVSIRSNMKVLNASHYSSIQSAINALPAEGGAVFVPQGAYEIATTITLKTNQCLYGSTQGTTIKLAKGANCTAIATQFQTKALKQNTVSNILIANLNVEGDYANQSEGGGISFIHSKNVLVSKVRVERPFRAAYGIEYCTNVRLIGCYACCAGDDNFAVGTGANGIVIVDCVSEKSRGALSASSSGFEMDDGATNVTISNCTTRNNYGYGIQIHNHITPFVTACPSNIMVTGHLSEGERGIACVLGNPEGNTTILNISITNSVCKSPRGKGAYLVGRIDGAIIEGITFDKTPGGIDVRAAGAAVPKNVIIADIEITRGTGASFKGIYALEADNITISRVRCGAMSGTGIQLDSAVANARIEGCHVEYASGVSGYGILSKTQGAVISGNTVSRCAYGILVYGDDSTISSNVVNNSGSRNVYISDADNCVAIGNSLYDGIEGLRTTGSHGIISGNNVFKGSGTQYYGIKEWASADFNRITGNIAMGHSIANLWKLGKNSIVNNNRDFKC